MNLFAFILCALASACLAADSDSNSSSGTRSNTKEVDDNSAPSAKRPKLPVSSLLRMSLSQNFLYLAGLELSEIGGIIKLKRYASNLCVIIEVCPEKMVGYGGISGMEKEHTRVVFHELFKYNLLNKELKAIGENMGLSLSAFRALCLDCVKFPEAILAVDVAILHWIVEYVEGDAELLVDFDVIRSVCFLSVHPDISVHCEAEITRALEIFSKCFQSAKRFFFNFLVNLIQFIDSHGIREIVETIVTSLYTSAEAPKWRHDCRLILGPDDAFLAILEGELTGNEQNELANLVNDYYPNCFFKFYSKGECFRLPCLFYGLHDMSKHLFIRADVDNEDNLLWKNDCSSWKTISFADTSLPVSSLFIVYENSPPSIFWAKIRSCKNFREFNELLTTPEMKHFILYYDITIMETDTKFSITSPLEQLDNQAANV